MNDRRRLALQRFKAVLDLCRGRNALGKMEVTKGVVAHAELALQFHDLLGRIHGLAVFPRHESAKLCRAEFGGRAVLFPKLIRFRGIDPVRMIDNADPKAAVTPPPLLLSAFSESEEKRFLLSSPFLCRDLKPAFKKALCPVHDLVRVQLRGKLQLIQQAYIITVQSGLLAQGSPVMRAGQAVVEMIVILRKGTIDF